MKKKLFSFIMVIFFLIYPVTYLANEITLSSTDESFTEDSLLINGTEEEKIDKEIEESSEFLDSETQESSSSEELMDDLKTTDTSYDNFKEVLLEQEYYEKISKDVSIKPDASFNIHSKPYPYQGYKVTGNTKTHQGKQVHLSQQAKTSSGTFYLADGIGWIRNSAFTSSLDTVTKSNLTRQAKINNKEYPFYKEPYNTKGSYQLGSTTKELFGKDVTISQKALNNRSKDVSYYIKNYGWVSSDGISLYEDEVIKNISKDVSITSTANFNIHSKPYPYQGYQVTGNTKTHQGKQVHLSKEAKTSSGLFYLADGIGWIRHSAFTSSLDTATKKNTNQIAKVKSDAYYAFYKEPYNTKGSYKIGTSSKQFSGQEVTLTKVATNNRSKEVFYYMEGHGWISKKAFSKIYEQENITSVSKDLTIKFDANFNVHSKPYPYHGFKVTGKTTPYKGKQVHISKQAQTTSGLFYLADGIGWIRSSAFTTKLDTVTKTTFNRDAKILNKTGAFYTQPYNTLHSERNGKTTTPIKNTDVVLTQKAVSKQTGNVFYHVKNYGWISKGSLLVYDIPNYEKINMKLQVKPNVAYNVHTQPYPYKGYKVIGTTSSRQMNGKTYQINRMATTSNGIYYEVSNHGWVNKNAFQKERTVSTFLGTSRSNVLNELTKHEKDRFYLGTPYRSVNWSNDPNAAMSPLGAPNKYGPGFNCTGFVAYSMRASGGNINKITQEANAWGGVANAYNWRDALKKNTDYTTYNTVDQLLKSGKAKKGDILYFEPDYSRPGYDCHIGIFWGNNSSHNRIWHSTGPGNNISNIYSGTPFTKIYLFPMD